MNSYLVLLASGMGKRMECDVNKVFLPIGGIPALIRSLSAFTSHCKGAVIAAREDEFDTVRELLTKYHMSQFVCSLVAGGSERQYSVRAGLQALPDDAEIVLIHDAARPLVTEEVIERAITSAATFGSGIASVPVTDTIKRVDANGAVVETPDRSSLYAMQTPQAFRREIILSAHEKAAADHFLGTDDASLLEHAYMPVHLSSGDRMNIKLTTPMDIHLAELLSKEISERRNGKA